MLKVLTYAHANHDWRLALLATVICVIAALVAFRLYGGTTAASGRGRAPVGSGPGDHVPDQPSIDEALAQSAPRRAPVKAAGGARILLAEDNDINALLATRLLEGIGLEVSRVEDGAKAVQATRDWAFDLILMDVQMPILDGLQATRMIRELPGRAGAMPIIALTANTMRADRETCLGAGMDDFLAKPFVAEAFLEVVTRYLSEAGEAVRARRMARTDAPDLDLVQLDSLARLLPPDQLEAMARGHLEQTDELLERMAACLEIGDLGAIAPAAHACRGAWAEFGGRRVQQLAGQLERACRDGDAAAAARLVEALRQAAQAAAARLEDYLATAAHRKEQRAV